MLNDRGVEKICEFKPIRLHETSHLAPSGECKRNIVARIGERRFCLHQTFKYAPLLRAPLCISYVFLFDLQKKYSQKLVLGAAIQRSKGLKFKAKGQHHGMGS